MNVEQNLIMRDRDLFSNAHNALTNKIVQELVNLYASIIRSTDDEIIRTELERVSHYANAPFIERYNITVEFMGKDDIKYSKNARLTVKYSNSGSGIAFVKELL